MENVGKILYGVELLEGTIPFFSILCAMALFAYRVLAHPSDENAKRLSEIFGRHTHLFGLGAFLALLLFAVLLQALAG